jgi:hypothetical protein
VLRALQAIPDEHQQRMEQLAAWLAEKEGKQPVAPA